MGNCTTDDVRVAPYESLGNVVLPTCRTCIPIKHKIKIQYREKQANW